MENHDDEELIRQKMLEARNSLTEKLETLEDSVVGTVSETADVVKETVATVKDAVEETTETVKEAVADGVDTVRHWLDFSGHVQDYPWLMMAGAAGVGFCLETMVSSGTSAAPAQKPATSTGHHRTHHNGNGHTREKRKIESGGWLSEFAPQLSKLKGMALGALASLVKETVLKAVPQQMQETVKEVIDSASRKLAGEAAPEGEPSFAGASQQGERNEYDPKRVGTEVGRPMGPTRRQG